MHTTSSGPLALVVDPAFTAGFFFASKLLPGSRTGSAALTTQPPAAGAKVHRMA